MNMLFFTYMYIVLIFLNNIQNSDVSLIISNINKFPFMCHEREMLQFTGIKEGGVYKSKQNFFFKAFLA